MARLEVNSSLYCIFAALLIALTVAACSNPPARTIPRVVDGKVEHGPVVSPYAYEWFVAGEVAATKGQHEEAALAFETARAAPTADPYLLARLAEEYEHSGDSRRAERALAAAGRTGRTSQESARIALARGRVLEARGDVQGALQAYDEAYEANPEDGAALNAIASLLDARGNTRRARAVRTRQTRFANGNQQAAVRALIDSALVRRDLDDLARLMRTDAGAFSAEQKRAAAHLAWRNQRPELAEAWIRDVRQGTDDHIIWVRALIAMGEVPRAANALVRGKNARFGGPTRRAQLLLDVGRPDVALGALRAAPDVPRTAYLRGRALRLLGRYAEASTQLSGVPYGARDYDDARRELATCLEEAGRPGEAQEIRNAEDR